LKFPSSGFGTPVINVAVVSGDGKTTEKVLVAKSGDAYIAKREGEPALYQLDYPVVAAIQEAAVNVKAAPPPPAQPKKK
jgi:hypothetical protein